MRASLVVVVFCFYELWIDRVRHPSSHKLNTTNFVLIIAEIWLPKIIIQWHSQRLNAKNNNTVSHNQFCLKSLVRTPKVNCGRLEWVMNFNHYEILTMHRLRWESPYRSITFGWTSQVKGILSQCILLAHRGWYGSSRYRVHTDIDVYIHTTLIKQPIYIYI